MPTAPGLVYSGDCGRADDLLPLVRRGDTLLCESAFGAQQSDPVGIHLTAGEAAASRASRGAARLILTHILDREDRTPCSPWRNAVPARSSWPNPA